MSKQKEFAFSLFFEEMSDCPSKGVFLIDSDGRLEKINAAFTKILGYDQKEIIGKHFVDLRHDLSQGSDRLKKLTEDFELYFFCLAEKNAMPMIMRHKDGYPVYVRLCSEIIRNSTNQIRNAIGIFEKAEMNDMETALGGEDALDKKIREMEQNFNSILDNSGDAIIVGDFNTRIVTVNKALLRLLHYDTEDELVGKHLVDVGPYEGTFTSTTGETVTLGEGYQKEQVEVINELFASEQTHTEQYLCRKDNSILKDNRVPQKKY